MSETNYITRAELQRMVDACPADTLAGKRDRLLLVVLRALNGRSGEVATLRMCDVKSYYHGIDLIAEDQLIPVPAREYTDHLPSLLLQEWLNCLPERKILESTAPLFRAITKDDRLSTRGHPCDSGRLTPASINLIVKRAAERAGFDPEQFSARRMRGPTRRKAAR